MPALIPERTIDSLFAFEFLSVAPTAVLWSPNARNPGTTKGSGSTSSPGNVDHEVGGRRRFDVECKTIYTDSRGAWINEISNRQLNAYAMNATVPMFYLLPAIPARLNAPWIRDCDDDPDSFGRCRACANPPKGTGALHDRRWAGLKNHVLTAPAERKLQPWFNHWAWCVRPKDLLSHLSSSVALPWAGKTELSASDRAHAETAGSIRFCHLLSAIEADWNLQPATQTADPSNGTDADERYPDVVLSQWSTAELDQPVADFPELDDEDDGRRVLAAY